MPTSGLYVGVTRSNGSLDKPRSAGAEEPERSDGAAFVAGLPTDRARAELPCSAAAPCDGRSGPGVGLSAGFTACAAGTAVHMPLAMEVPRDEEARAVEGCCETGADGMDDLAWAGPSVSTFWIPGSCVSPTFCSRRGTVSSATSWLFEEPRLRDLLRARLRLPTAPAAQEAASVLSACDAQGPRPEPRV